MFRPAELTSLEPAPPKSAHSREQTTYDRAFWYAYTANTLIMVAVSLLFRYADFIHYLGGTELNLGWIVGIGMIGSLLMRMAQGRGIDQFGPRFVWVLSNCFFILSLVAHLFVTNVDGLAIYIVRIAFNTSVAGIFGASITNISLRAPTHRLAEVLGTLGTSGFLGMMLGTLLGDRLFGAGPIGWEDLRHMFIAAACLGAVSMGFAILATRDEVRHSRRHNPPLLWLVRRYHPGRLLVIGIMMGVGLGMPQIFVRAFTADIGLPGIAVFFWIYAPAAFIARMATRQLPDRIGVRPTIIIGLTCLSLGCLTFIPVTRNIELVPSAILIGVAHAMLFPAVVAGGTTGFPGRYRGLGTTLMLACFDLGNLLGMPALGGVIHLSGKLGLPSYPTMFVSLSTVMAVVAAWYAIGSRGEGRVRMTPRRQQVIFRKRSKPRVDPQKSTVAADNQASLGSENTLEELERHSNHEKLPCSAAGSGENS